MPNGFTQGNQSASMSAASTVRQQYQCVRALSEALCQDLLIEDYGLQAMPETSPAKWHIAHTSWFFETFLLKPHYPQYQPFDTQFEYLFNSYYNAIGEQFPRVQRGLLARPSVAEVFEYRGYIDMYMDALFSNESLMANKELVDVIILGCHHEQQHQELFLTDLKYCWAQTPLYPALQSARLQSVETLTAMTFQSVAEGLYSMGHQHADRFCFDNELPAHKVYLPAYQMGTRLVSNGEYLAFINDSGYQRPELWLADGWAHIKASNSNLTPLYWVKQGGCWFEYTLHGLQVLDLNGPVAHVSAYEADAYARWAGCRLPTESEWEIYSQQAPQGAVKIEDEGFYQSDHLHPHSAKGSACDLLGKLWQWTSSAYSPYPGFKIAEGAVGEYNGKFMANQLVLRGGSCATSASHYRLSYRNFFYAKDQWQFTGICLARDIDSEQPSQY